MKKFLFLTLLVFSISVVFAQLQSPSDFLGYTLGSRYSPHFKVVNYFQHVANSTPSMVKLEKYGETYEGRPLYIAFVGSAENISRLESIRLQNLSNAGFEKQPSSSSSPAIVWLSYNVHGNETSSSEAAMQTIYELVNPKNTNSKEWLKNTLVIIDPCMNPDGRDRYVNWFNSVSGQNPDPQAFSREHREPWPRGRANHYYFDLNRDWAWQSQVETQQRIVKYNQWLPHIHVDFHEQGYNEPYYFAPAAEPFHEVITPWQREFQTVIGRNHAKHFDHHGWLYFTKERFDLFYPSYGDTYPTYKGAIGMTYEQGGIGSGLAVIIEDGDTLTLTDRVAHHYTTGMSTVEITAKHANKVVEEFIRYYDKARSTPVGEFKSYIIRNSSGDAIERLKTLLDRNAIEWNYSNAGNLSGINYLTGKNESFKTTGNDIVINANQPNSNLIRVLFERNSKLSDSVTYDITAWSLPYVYGLNAYGLSGYVTNTTKKAPAVITGTTPNSNAGASVNSTETNANNISSDVNKDQTKAASYAYVVKWNGVNSAKFLSLILKHRVRVRFAEQPFLVNGQQYEKGTLIITRSGNTQVKDLDQVIRNASSSAKIDFASVTTGFVEKGYDLGSDRVRVLRAPRVALLAGEQVSSLGMGEIWHFLDRQLEYPVHIVNVDELNASVLRNLDVVIMPDGFYSSLNEKPFNDALKNWVSSGGKIIAIENAAVQLSKADWGFKLKAKDDKKEEDKQDKKEDYSALKIYEERERDMVTEFNPGSIFRIQMDNTHPLAFGYEDNYFSLKQDDNIYEFIKTGGWNVGVIKKDNYVTGFAGSKAKERLRDGMLYGEKEMGRGSIIILADNPLFRSFWENGKLLFCNALFMTGQ